MEKNTSLSLDEIENVLTGERLTKFQTLLQLSANFTLRYWPEAVLWAFAKGETYEDGFYEPEELTPREEVLFHLIIQTLAIKINQTIFEAVKGGIMETDRVIGKQGPAKLKTRIEKLQKREAQLQSLLRTGKEETEESSAEFTRLDQINHGGLVTILAVFHRALVSQTRQSSSQ